MKDGRGNEITTNNAECMVLINKFEDAVISYEGDGNEYLKKAVEADPSCPYANTLSALFSIFEGNLEKADNYLSTSLSLLSQSSLREKLYYHSVSSFRHRQQLHSLDYHLRIASLFPTDVFNVKIGQIHCLLTGNKEKTLEIPFTALSQTSSNFYLLYQNPSFTPSPDDHLHHPSRDHSLPRNIENESNEERYKREGYLHGMYAFGLVEMNYFHEAEIVSRYSTQSSITNHLNDPWSHHTVAHALEEQGKVMEGIHFMENHSHYWADRNHFMRSHNWWHLSLYYLDKLQEEKVFELYNQQIFPSSNQSMLSEVQVQIGASALLWRLNLHHIDVGKRWKELEEKIDKEKMPLHPFVDLHFIYALAKGGQKENVNEIFRKFDTEIGIDPSLDPYLSPPSPSFPFSPPPLSPLFPSEHQFHFAHPFDQFDPQMIIGVGEIEKDERRIKRDHDRNEFQKKIFVMIAKGVVHQAYGEYELAYRYLHPSIPFVSIIGGSTAQQDVWVQTYVDVLVNTERWEEVNEILKVRTERRPAAPHSFSLLAQSFLHLDDLPNYHLNLHQSHSLRSLYSS